MEYNIGDLVVRYLNNKYYWHMIGIITNKRQVSGETYYGIKWANPKHKTNSDRWQSNEFELIEKAKKVSKKT